MCDNEYLGVRGQEVVVKLLQTMTSFFGSFSALQVRMWGKMMELIVFWRRFGKFYGYCTLLKSSVCGSISFTLGDVTKIKSKTVIKFGETNYTFSFNCIEKKTGNVQYSFGIYEQPSSLQASNILWTFLISLRWRCDSRWWLIGIKRCGTARARRHTEIVVHSEHA